MARARGSLTLTLTLALAVAALLACACVVPASATGVQSQTQAGGEDLSLLDIYSSMPVDLSTDPSEAASIAATHLAAGEEADEAIREAMHQTLLLETQAATEAESELGAVAKASHGKWDASVPEVHLKTAQSDEAGLLSTELETVDRLDSFRPSLTNEPLRLQSPSSMLAPLLAARAPAVLGEDHSFLAQRTTVANTAATQQTNTAAASAGAGAAANNQAQTQAQTQAQAQSQAQAASSASSLTASEAEAGVLTLSELKDMMSLQGLSQAEIQTYLASLADLSTHVEADTSFGAEVETETESESEAESDSENEAEAETDSEAEAESDSEAEAETESESEADSESESESENESESESEAESEESHEQHAEHEAEHEAEESHSSASPSSASASHALVESSSAADSETHAEGQTEAWAAGTAEASAESAAELDVVHVSPHAAPAVLQQSVPGSVTPLHSDAYRATAGGRRVNSRLRAVQQATSGYSLPQPTAMLQTQAAASHAAPAAPSAAPAFNPSAVQLGPSRDAYGFHPMTGAEFLTSPSAPSPSLAQVSMQLQNQGRTWLPPPLPQHAVPNYVVGMGGLQPNINAGPNQGQYGMAAGGQVMAQPPAFIQY